MTKKDYSVIIVTKSGFESYNLEILLQKLCMMIVDSDRSNNFRTACWWSAISNFTTCNFLEFWEIYQASSWLHMYYIFVDVILPNCQNWAFGGRDFIML